MRFEISKRARRQIEKISRWWIDNRRAAPSMFLDELAEAERILRQNPEAGLAYATHRTGVVRRLLLAGTTSTTGIAQIGTRSWCSLCGAHRENAARDSEDRAWQETATVWPIRPDQARRRRTKTRANP